MNPKLGCADLHLCYTMEQAQYTQFCSVFECAVTECKNPRGILKSKMPANVSVFSM
jgi:hypothetical protein